MVAFRFHSLRKAVWDQPALSIKTKARVYKVTVMATDLFGAESWTCSSQEYTKLNAFHRRRLWQIVGNRRIGLTEKKLYRMTGSAPMEAVVRRFRLRWS